MYGQCRDPCTLLLLSINPVFMHSAAKKVQYPAYRDLLKVAWFNKMTVQVPKP